MTAPFVVHPANCQLCSGSLFYMKEAKRDKEKISYVLMYCPNAKFITPK